MVSPTSALVVLEFKIVVGALPKLVCIAPTPEAVTVPPPPPKRVPAALIDIPLFKRVALLARPVPPLA